MDLDAKDRGINIAAYASLILVWALLGVSYFELFIPPFDFIGDWLMPWRLIFDAPPDTAIHERVQYLQSLLDRSVLIANMGLALMVLSFMALGIYLSVVLQQKQQRANENRLLRLKNDEIARRNEFIRYISATIGHEFKNNLGRIKRRIDLLDLPLDARGRLDVNLDKLFADIDIFKKISDEREAGLIEFERLNIKALLNDLIDQYSDLIECSKMPGLAEPMIFASRSLLKTVFENILDNAAKYKKQTQQKALLTVACSTDIDGTRRYITLSFKDQGIGMNEVQAERCFYKGKSSADGWGEGLYYAKYVVGLHAGKIRVGMEHTAPGEGAEFIIKLPYVEEALNV